VKHNELDREDPLVVKIALAGGALTVENRRRPRPLDRPSAKVGLSNLEERYRLATERAISIEVTPDRFTVHLPLLSVG
jgi:two-component system LytT family sensor kinase